MSSICAKLSANVGNCVDETVLPGVSSDLYLGNFDDVQDAAITYNEAGEITDIVFDTTADYLYRVKNFTNKVRPNTTSAGVGRVMQKHSVAFQVPYDTQEAKNKVEEILNGKYVAFVITNSNKIVVYGLRAGLVNAPQVTQDYYVEEGAHTIMLASSDDALEPKLPVNLVGPDTTPTFQSAKAYLLTLVAA